MSDKSSSSTSKQAQAAASSGSEVRERISKLTTDALRDRKLKLSDLPGLAAEVMDGAVEGVKQAMPQEQGSVLRQVVDGLGDAYDAAAKAATGAVRSVRKHGTDFVENEVRPTAHDLKKVQEDVFDTVGGFGHRLSDELSKELKAVVSRAKRAGESVGPPVREAADAVDGRFMQMTGEVASTGARVARRAAENVMMAASGLLEGLAATMSPTKKSPAMSPAKKRTKSKGSKSTTKGSASKKTASKSSGKKKSTKKSAKKTAKKSAKRTTKKKAKKRS